MATALVMFFDESAGGRITPPYSGYRPQIQLGNTLTTCLVYSLSNSQVFSFKEEWLVSLTLMFPDQYPNAFSQGQNIALYEGSKLIGKGKIISL